VRDSDFAGLGHKCAKETMALPAIVSTLRPFICWSGRSAGPLSAAPSLIETDSNADAGVFEHVLALDPYHFAALDTGIAAFLFRQGRCPREIDFDNMIRSNRRGDWNRDKNAGLADIGAAAVDESVGFRQPYTHRPRKVGSDVLTLFD